MFGLGDLPVSIAYAGSVAATVVCVVYGALNWNRSDEDSGK